MTRRDILAFVFRWKTTIIGWWLFVIALSVVLVYVKPPGFEAETAVLIERTKSPVFTPATYATPEFVAPDMAEAMNTEVQIVGSRPVLEAVVEKLGLLELPPAPEETNPIKAFRKGLRAFMVELGLRNEVPPLEGWIEDLSEGLKATPLVDSNVLQIQFGGKEPEFTMQVVNAITDAYIDHRRAIHTSSGGSDYFQGKMEEAEQELAELRNAMDDFRARYSVTALSEGRGELVREIGVVRERLAALQQQRADLTSRFAADHPRVQVVDRNIVAAKRDLEVRNTEMKELEETQSTINELTVLIASQEKLFLDYKTRYEAERAREQAPGNLINAKVIEYAAVPARPTRSRMFFIKVAILGGFMLAVLIAFLREYFDMRLKRPEEAERALGVPVMGSIGKRRALARY